MMFRSVCFLALVCVCFAHYGDRDRYEGYEGYEREGEYEGGYDNDKRLVIVKRDVEETTTIIPENATDTESTISKRSSRHKSTRGRSEHKESSRRDNDHHEHSSHHKPSSSHHSSYTRPSYQTSYYRPSSHSSYHRPTSYYSSYHRPSSHSIYHRPSYSSYYRPSYSPYYRPSSGYHHHHGHHHHHHKRDLNEQEEIASAEVPTVEDEVTVTDEETKPSKRHYNYNGGYKSYHRNNYRGYGHVYRPYNYYYKREAIEEPTTTMTTTTDTVTPVVVEREVTDEEETSTIEVPTEDDVDTVTDEETDPSKRHYNYNGGYNSYHRNNYRGYGHVYKPYNNYYYKREAVEEPTTTMATIDTITPVVVKRFKEYKEWNEDWDKKREATDEEEVTTPEMDEVPAVDEE